ncbi:V-type ATPase subunit [Caviibacter abscessus]|uniref:V-type ATPase subunit n=1 Tax=Caviibacter abscessus TaxID=1766719 RepID=UPI00082BA49C|nr:V-type ATPase subunit [Caviibacter abscessus]
MIDKMEYVQAAALVKVAEKKLLNSAKLMRMIDANTALDILKILSETDYSKSMAGVVKEEDYEEILSNEIKKVYSFARTLAKKHQEIVDILALKYEFQNLKLRLKASMKNKNVDQYFVKLSNIDLENEYKKAYEMLEKTNDISQAVIYIDKMYYEKLKIECEKTGLEIFSKYYNLLIDSYNLLTFLRLKNQNRSIKYANYCIFDNEALLNIYEKDSYMEDLRKMFDDKSMWEKFAKTGKISVIEKELDNLQISLIKQYKDVNYGVEPIITYILAKEYEMKAIRLIMTGKINKINTNIIKERMREIYV